MLIFYRTLCMTKVAIWVSYLSDYQDKYAVLGSVFNNEV